MKPSTELDRKARPAFYVISLGLMIIGILADRNAWLIGGGLAVYLITLIQDAEDQEKAKEVEHERDRGIDKPSKD